MRNESTYPTKASLQEHSQQEELQQSREVETTNVHQLVSELWPLHTGEHYLASTRNKVLIQATPWMKLKTYLCRSQKDHILSDFIYMRCPEKVKMIESRWVVESRWVGLGNEEWLNLHQEVYRLMEMFLKFNFNEAGTFANLQIIEKVTFFSMKSEKSIAFTKEQIQWHIMYTWIRLAFKNGRMGGNEPWWSSKLGLCTFIAKGLVLIPGQESHKTWDAARKKKKKKEEEC